MPRNPYEAQEQKTQAQEEVETQEETIDGEPPKFSAEARNDDPQTKSIAQNVFNKIFEIKNEEALEKDEKPTDIIKSNEDYLDFTSKGKDQILIVQPSDSNVSYNIDLISLDGKFKRSISNRRGNFKARVAIDKGEYKIIIKSQGGPIPFAVKVE